MLLTTPIFDKQLQLASTYIIRAKNDLFCKAKAIDF